MDDMRLFNRALINAKQRFMNIDKMGSRLLLLSTAVALIWANSPWHESYTDLWATNITFNVGSFYLSNSLAHWINDGLMFFFFLLVGLEVKREVLVGELRHIKKAALPLVAALGGMLVPGGIYIALNFGKPGFHGWGIPMATDIAFAVGCMMILGDRVPNALKIFLMALAIFDDIGAIIVIALFYSTELSAFALLMAAIILALLIAFNRLGVRNLSLYMFLGFFLWLFFLQSGIHATIAGVLLAFTIPGSPRYTVSKFVEESRAIWARFVGKEYEIMPVDTQEMKAVEDMKAAVLQVQSPMRRLEDTLSPWSALFIIPVFALANAGVNVVSSSYGLHMNHSVTIGIIGGLFLGKPIGITLFSWLAVKLKLANFPGNTSIKGIASISILGGIGFTMSLFIINLAFTDPFLTHQAKLGILAGSFSAAIIGILFLSLTHKHPAPAETAEEN